jgi:hypothetical protein
VGHFNVACRSYVVGAFYRLSQAITLSLTGGFAIFWFKTGLFAKLTCDGRDRLIDAINLARKEGRVIITYSNHCSTIDDPGIMPCLVPPLAPNTTNYRFHSIFSGARPLAPSPPLHAMGSVR